MSDNTIAKDKHKQTTLIPWILIFCSCGFVILCEFQPFGILPEIFIILGVLGAIIGFTWCALIEKRNQERSWFNPLVRAIILAVLLLGIGLFSLMDLL